MDTTELTLSWYNYQTQQYDEKPVVFSSTATDEEVKPYLPQTPAAQTLFRALRSMGKSVPDAMIYVLEACTGTEHSKPLDAHPKAGKR